MIIARLITSLAIAALPAAALADSSGVSLQGPSAGEASGASTGTLNTLQPANSSGGLQTTGTDGVSQSPDQSALQNNAGDQAKLLVLGDSDGTPQKLDADSPSAALYIGGIVLTLLIVSGAVVWLARHDLQRTQTAAPAPIDKPKERPKAKKPAKKRKNKAKS